MRARLNVARARFWKKQVVVLVDKLVGVYSSPHLIGEYPDGNRVKGVVLCFQAHPIGGELCVGDETTEFGYFSPEQMKSMDVMEPIDERVADALSVEGAAFVP